MRDPSLDFNVVLMAVPHCQIKLASEGFSLAFNCSVLNILLTLYFEMPSICPSVSATVSSSINPLPSDRLRCCDRHIRCHRLLAVKPLSPREHAGRRVGKGGTLGSVHTERHPIPWSRLTVAARTGQWSWVDILFSKSNNYNNT